MFLKKFIKSEEGAVTIEYVVLTAMAVCLALALFSSIEGPLDDAIEKVTDHLEELSD